MCTLPRHPGSCLTDSIRFYHDYDVGACKKFRYSGCGGNGNNFLTGEDCVRTCGGLLEIDRRLPAPLAVKTPSSLPHVPSAALISSTTTSATTTTTLETSTSTTGSPTTTPPEASAAIAADAEGSFEEQGHQSKNHRFRGGGGGAAVRARKRLQRVPEDSVAKPSSSPPSSAAIVVEYDANGDAGIVHDEVAYEGIQRSSRDRNGNRGRARLTSVSIFPKSPTLAVARFADNEPGAEIRAVRPLEETAEVRTQTSRSVVMARRVLPRAETQDSEGGHHHAHVQPDIHHHHQQQQHLPKSVLDAFASRRPSPRVLKVLGNVTRATPSGVTRFPASHRLHPDSATGLADHGEEGPAGQSERKGRGEGFTAAVAEVSLGHRPGQVGDDDEPEEEDLGSASAASLKIDQVVEAPSDSSAPQSDLVVVRSFCRSPPIDSDLPKCQRSGEQPLYFYNVTSATCEPVFGAYCLRSRNRFMTPEDCLRTCVVDARGFVTLSSDLVDEELADSKAAEESIDANAAPTARRIGLNVFKRRASSTASTIPVGG